jgi:hypothetical protein
MIRATSVLVLCAVAALTAVAQPTAGTLKGKVSDEFGGVIVGATIRAVDPNGVE